jgi:hypothetical protein
MFVTLAMVVSFCGRSKYTLFAAFIFLLVLSPTLCAKTNAQFLPIPSPDFDQKAPTNVSPVKGDNEPPVIKFITDTLQVGNNVFKLTITAKSAIDVCEVSYFRDGKNVTDDCINDNGNLYKSLIKIDSPVPHTIEVYTKDSNGNISTEVKQLMVQPQRNIFEQIFDKILRLF